MGGVKTISNKKGLRRRMVVIQSALDSPDLGQASKYPEHWDNTFRKILASLEVKNFTKNR